MKKLIGRVVFGALAAALTPYRVQRSKETGAFELNSLLWSLKKTPVEGKDNYVFELFPLLGKQEKPAGTEEASAAE